MRLARSFLLALFQLDRGRKAEALPLALSRSIAAFERSREQRIVSGQSVWLRGGKTGFQILIESLILVLRNFMKEPINECLGTDDLYIIFHGVC